MASRRLMVEITEDVKPHPSLVGGLCRLLPKAGRRILLPRLLPDGLPRILVVSAHRLSV